MLGSLYEALPESLVEFDVVCEFDSESDCESESLETESLSLLADEFQLYDGDPSDSEWLADSLFDSLDSDKLDSEVDESLDVE